LKRFPNISRELQKRGFDLTSQPIPVTPAAHFMCGGITTDIYGRTTIKNLFAYGEVAATGVHGANRLASNSLLEGMVFSNQIQYCIEELPEKFHVIARSETTRPHKVDSPIVGKQSQTRLPRFDRNDEKVTEITSQIRELMWQYVGIVRTPQGLTTARKKLLTLQQELEKIKGTNSSFIELTNMLAVGLLITAAAQKRQQSLGTHYLQQI